MYLPIIDKKMIFTLYFDNIFLHNHLILNITVFLVDIDGDSRFSIYRGS